VCVFVFNQQEEKEKFLSLDNTRRTHAHLFIRTHARRHKESGSKCHFNDVDSLATANLRLISAISLVFSCRARPNSPHRRPLDARHHHAHSGAAGRRLLLVAAQALAARVRGAVRRPRDEQRQPQVPAAARDAAGGAVAGGAEEAGAAAAATGECTSQQNQHETERIPEPEDTAHRVSAGG
jgi:hypothetical protein